MKTIQITETKKELLLVEMSSEVDYYEVLNHGIYIMLENGERDFIEGNYQLLCAYVNMTEGIAEELVHRVTTSAYRNYNTPDYMAYIFDSAIKSLKSAIEKHVYWENPCKKSYFNPEEFIQEEYNEFMEAESRTFDKTKTLIFVKS